jgi:hypothetical protein
MIKQGRRSGNRTKEILEGVINGKTDRAAAGAVNDQFRLTGTALKGIRRDIAFMPG